MRFLTGMLPLLLALGCARSTVLEDRDVANFRDIEPLPLQAAVSVKLQGDKLKHGEDHSRLWTDKLVQALKEINAFSDVRALDEAAGDSTASDIRLEVRMTPIATDYTAEAETTTSLAVLNGFLWFAAGVPAWFIADKVYPSLFSVTIDVTRPGLKEEDHIFSTSEPSVNFWDRSSTSQFLVQIVVPPPLVAEDPEELRESLELESLDDVYLRTAHYAKSVLPVKHAREGQTFVFQPPGVAGVVLLARRNISSLSVNGSPPIGAGEVGMLKFIEDHRITDLQERDRRLGSVERYFRDLAGGTPEVEEDLLTTEELGVTFRRSYWFKLDELAANDDPRPLRLEVEVEQHEKPIRWTLRDEKEDAGESPPLASARGGAEKEGVKE